MKPGHLGIGKTQRVLRWTYDYNLQPDPNRLRGQRLHCLPQWFETVGGDQDGRKMRYRLTVVGFHVKFLEIAQLISRDDCAARAIPGDLLSDSPENSKASSF